MPKNEGFSLIELLVALALSTLLGLAMLTLVGQFVQWNGNLGLLMDRDQRAQQGPLLLTRHLVAAGNRRWAGSWSGLEVTADELRAAADVTGEDGFPDGRLADSYESLSLRLRAGRLQIRSGRSGYQPLLKNVRAFQTEDWSPPLLRLRLVLETERKLRGVRADLLEPVSLNFYLWNYRTNWFEEGEPR